jgi:hypothetical protein
MEQFRGKSVCLHGSITSLFGGGLFLMAAELVTKGGQHLSCTLAQLMR